MTLVNLNTNVGSNKILRPTCYSQEFNSSSDLNPMIPHLRVTHGRTPPHPEHALQVWCSIKEGTIQRICCTLTTLKDSYLVEFYKFGMIRGLEVSNLNFF